MTNEPRAMREIHEIRERIYEETKNMTPSERTKHTKNAVAELVQMYGLKLNYAKNADNPAKKL